MNLTRPSPFSCCFAALVAALLLQPTSAYAAPITGSSLAEFPLQGSNPVKPNIMYTMDESGSMALATLPDYLTPFGEATPTYDAAPAVFNGTDFSPWCRGAEGVAGKSCALTSPPFASSKLNRIYYDPSINYNLGKRSDGADLPCEGSNTRCDGPWARVYTNGFDGYPGANSSTTANLVTGYPDEVFCWKAAPDVTADDIATARRPPDGDGSVCRRNGIAYPTATVSGVTTTAVAAGYNYPNSATAACLDTATTKCVFGRATYCWKPNATSGEMATARSDGSVCRYNGVAYPSVTVAGVTSTATDGTIGYPNSATASCPDTASYKCVFSRLQQNRTAAVGNPYYYTITSVQFCPSRNTASGWGTGACTPGWTPTNKYVKYGAAGLDATAFARVDIVPFAGTNAFGRTYAQEMANFAKWYAFARTRVLAMKTAGGIAFSALDQSSRIGFNTLNSFCDSFAFCLAPRSNFLNIQDFTPAYKETWFTKFYAVVPGSATPSLDAMWRIGEYFSNRGAAAGLPGATDPLDPTTGQCQLNFHLLSTDGYWYQQDPIPGFTDRIGNRDLTVPGTLPGQIAGFVPGQPFPLPYREGPGAASRSSIMSDYAMYYWINDIRPTLANRVKDAIAPWQHVTFLGLAIGAEGTLPYPTGIDDITSGAVSWPVPPSANGNSPEAIDDLWHAAVNSRGTYFNAQNAQELAESMVTAVSGATDQAGTGTAVGLAGAQLTSTTSFGYKTSYDAGWTGDVQKYALDPLTGALPVDANGVALNAPVWSAATKVDAQAAGTGWDTQRRLVTINDSSNAAVPFRFANLSSAQQNSLANAWSTVSPPPTPEQVFNFLRGDRSNEGIRTTNFRIRSHILGDIVGSAAVVVGAPRQPYDNAGNPGYTSFASTRSSRTSTVYVGANDGMVHAFNDSSSADAGKETWAFIPKTLFSGGDPNDTSHAPSPEFQLGALSYRRGGIPRFQHKFYVNATPRAWDIDAANTNTRNPPQTGNDWRTLLVGGLGAGGRAVYALDVTTPVLLTDSEDAVASHVLWEFTDANLGYVFDAPTLVKTRRYGWVVLVASGYNNPGGEGILYVLNPMDGAILKKLSTGVGSNTDPSGLSTIRAFTPSRKDPYVLQAYGGDLKGNVWRFDLSDPDESNWRVDLIAKLTDPRGRAQPITTGVRVEIDQLNAAEKRFLFVGTGKMLDQPDLGDTTVTNTLYVIRDGTSHVPDPAPLTPYSRDDLNSVTGTSVGGFTTTATNRGWFQDATEANQKIVTDVIADVQTVVAVFSKQSEDPCEAALSSSLYARDFLSGESVLLSSTGTVTASIADIGAIAGVSLIQAGVSNTSSGTVRVQVTTMKGQVFAFGLNLPFPNTAKHRVSWRLINRD